MGKLKAAKREQSGWEMTFSASVVLEGTKLGDSIAVNGTCLTVTAFDAAGFKVGVAPETRSRTNLVDLVVGDPVNLERAVTPSTRLGGHYVQGHVDGVGRLIDIRCDRDALWFTIRAAEDIMRYVVPKGFIALDGTSLTVVDVKADHFTVMLVPFTQDHIILPGKKVGYGVNIEVDILGKYVEKFLAGARSGGVDKQFLRDHGYGV